MRAHQTTKNMVFDYRALRLLVGCIALLIPILVTVIADQELASISASYYTSARDVFVGLLFVVGAFLWAYNGRTKQQKIASKIAAIGAIGVAVFPTACKTCELTVIGQLHYACAAILFAVLALFCFIFFRKDIKGQGGKKGRRSKIYYACGVIIVLSMLLLASQNLIDFEQLWGWRNVTFWGETAALSAFGVAWIVAGKYLPVLTDKSERLHLG